MKLHWKKCLLVIHKILQLFVKTLTVNDKHYALNQPLQMQLSQKQKIFPELFFQFLKSILKIKH